MVRPSRLRFAEHLQDEGGEFPDGIGLFSRLRRPHTASSKDALTYSRALSKELVFHVPQTITGYTRFWKKSRAASRT
jgi:hypothetical protein